jgi:hypothetical protein
MTGPSRPPTDQDLERLLRARASHPDPKLLEDILSAADASPQRGPWYGAGFIRRRPTILLTAAAMTTLMLGGALALGSDPSPIDPSPAPSEHPRVHQVDEGEELEAGVTYWVDPDFNTSTPLYVDFSVPAAGWLGWTGTYKDVERDGVLHERLTISIVEVSNLTQDACANHGPRNPAVGPTVEDLAEALTEQPPFEVASAPRDVSAYGYRGKHLALRIPDDMVADDANFAGCVGALRNWMAPIMGDGAYFGYRGPGDTEEYWILDVEDTRLVIAVLTTAGASPQLIAEGQRVLDSLVIVP